MKSINTLIQKDKRENYYKTENRLEKAISSGRFAMFTQRKKQELLQRIKRYARHLGLSLKPTLAAALLAAGILVGTESAAQTFTAQTGANNPLNGKVVANYSKPCFTDIDSDGDMDLYAGQYYANAMVFINSGTNVLPAFAAQNQFRYTADMHAAPAFVDIDNDGDKDLFMGKDDGSIIFYPNTGSVAAAAFPTYPPSGAANPLNGVDVGTMATPAFVDIDTDGDKDLFIGNGAGNVVFYKNTGTAGAPVFSLQAGAANPFDGVSAGQNAAPAFADLDGDGDADAAFGNLAGTFLYYKNTGTTSIPVFTQQTGTSNPFNTIDIGSYSAPALVDIDNDGDQDLFTGDAAGGFSFFKNTTSVLPLQWVSFSAQKLSNRQVLLNWTTSSEQNTRDFAVEYSADAKNWKQVGLVEAAGSTSNITQYKFLHPAADNENSYYRILQHDLNGRSSYSDVRNVKANALTQCITLLANPVTNGNLKIQATNAITVGFYNGSGQLLFQQQLSAGIQTIDVSRYTKGTYYLKVDGRSEKLIIQ